MAHILVVEDDPALNDAYNMILKKAGHQVETVFSGTEALEKVATKEPDLILLDLLMPDLDGVGFLKKYDVKAAHKKVKVIVFSNIDVQKKVEEAYALGADKYILKAWSTPQQLVKIVDIVLKEK